MRQALVFGTIMLTAACGLQAAEPQKVRLHIYGAYCPGCAGVLTQALVDAGVKNASKVPSNRGRGYVIVLGEIEEGVDLGALANGINEAATPHKSQAAPGLALELFAELDEASAASALESLAKVEGVDAEGCKTDVKSGTISIKLSGDEKVTVATIVETLAAGGVNAKIVTD